MADQLTPGQHPLFLIVALDALAANLRRNQWKRRLIDLLDSYASQVMHGDGTPPYYKAMYADYRAKVDALDLDDATRDRARRAGNDTPDDAFLRLAWPYLSGLGRPEWFADYADASKRREHFAAVTDDVAALTRALAAENADNLRKAADGAALVAGAE